MTREEEATNKILEFIDIVKDVPKNESILAIGMDMVEWADRTMLDRVCEFIEKKFTETIVGNVISRHETTIKEVINDLRKAMVSYDTTRETN